MSVLLTLTCSAPAAGGTFVARHEGRVVFVRGSAPGETVLARIEEDDPSARFWRAEALEVLEASPDRVPSVWPEAGTDGVGGAEWAHIALPAQRRIATEVLQDLLRRARVTTFDLDEAQVEPAPGDHDGLGWRTRARYAVSEDGRVGMRGWRSREVRPVGEDPLAVPAIRALRVPGWRPPAGTASIDVVGASDGRPAIVIAGEGLDPGAIALPPELDGADVSVRTARGLQALRGDALVRERAGGRRFLVGAAGFWQSHRLAAELLSELVARDLDVQPGESVWDLFGGVGLFAAGAAGAAGGTGEVLTVEGDRRASALAARNLADLPAVRAEQGDVTAWVRERRRAHRGRAPLVDRVVLDPPRAGAGAELIGLLTEAVAERIVYVSCEPSTLARDLRTAEERGWRLADLRAVDLFPHTHHIESVAVLERTA